MRRHLARYLPTGATAACGQLCAWQGVSLTHRRSSIAMWSRWVVLSIASAMATSAGQYELTDARFKGLIGYLANLEAEASENATEAEFDVREFMLQLLAPNQQRMHLLRSM